MARVRKHRSKWQVLARVSGRERSFGVYKLKADAERRRRDIEMELDRRNGQLPDYSARSVPLEDWIREQRVLKSLSDSTSERSESCLRTHIAPQIGYLAIGEISPDTMRRFLVYLSKAVGPATVRKVWGLVDSALERAVALGTLDTNPCAPLRRDLPRIRPTTVEPLPAGLVDQLIEKTDPRYAPMVELAAFAGMRWGEIAALRWTNINLQDGTVTVSGTLQRDGAIKEPKTPAGNRKVKIVPRTRDSLDALPRSSMWVFPAPSGGPLRYNNWRRRTWVPARDAVGLKSFTFKDLRHTHASWLIDRGIDVVRVSKRLGHSRPSTTANIYAHLIDVDEVEILAALEEIDANVEPMPRRSRGG